MTSFCWTIRELGHALLHSLTPSERDALCAQPLPMISYKKVFEETRDGDQGKFAETLRDQHLYDAVSTYPAIESTQTELSRRLIAMAT